MIKRGFFKRDFDGGLVVKPSLLADKSFKKADNLGINKEGFRVLTNGFKKLQEAPSVLNGSVFSSPIDPSYKRCIKLNLRNT